MSRKRFDQMECGIAQALEQVGDWWTLLIVRDCFLGTRRFADFERNLGIAKNILTARLERLVEDDILEKRLREGSERRFEYHLTQKGQDLWLVLTALRLWSDKWVFGRGNEPVLVEDSETGQIVRGLRVVDDDGETLDAARLRWIRPPHAPNDGDDRNEDTDEGGTTRDQASRTTVQ